MFQSVMTIEAHGEIQKIRLQLDEQPLTFIQVFQLWAAEAAFRDFYTDLLAQAPYRALRWEHPPYTRQSWDQAYEFVLINSPFLPDRADPTPFQAHFRGKESNQDVLTFPNLGGDALLVVPIPFRQADRQTQQSSAGQDHAAHLVSFLRGAAEVQVHGLWRAVGEAAQAHASERPTWLNTAGGGVDWLHARLDSRPKYYRYGEYRGF